MKLLRFLQEQEVRPVGDVRARQGGRARRRGDRARPRRSDVAAGRFREDLLYRLDVVGIRLPPLRERREDVVPLADALPRAPREAAPRRSPGSPSATTRGRRSSPTRWPGNVRELEHALERAVVLADGPLIHEQDLPDTVRAPAHPPAGGGAVPGDLSVKRATRALEEQLIRAALERTGGNRTRAAELLDLSYRALLYKIQDYGLGS